MFELSAHIEYLLMNHDCVVVPGLGAFLVHESSACYDDAKGQFMPPLRTLGFNQAVTLNDGLLDESVARKECLSIEAAHAKVEAVINAFRQQLNESYVLAVGRLGDMSCVDNSLIFEPSPASSASLRYRGLKPLSIKPIVTAGNEPENDGESSSGRRPVVLPLALKIAASLIILMVACGLFLTTGNLIGSRQSNFASLDSGLRAQVETPVRAAVDSQVAELPMSREIQLNISSPKAEPQSEQHKVKSVSPERYLLVVGSFPSMQSACRFVGDSDLDIIEMDGRYRIYAASASTLSEASRLADSLREDHPSVWICKR